MADGRHLEKSKIRHVSATDWPILMKFSTLAQILSLKRTIAVKDLNFWKSKMAAAAILKNRKIAISPQPYDRFSWNFTRWHALALLTPENIQNCNFKNPTWRTAAILKIENSPYLSNRLADLHEIWQAYADWIYQAYQAVTIWIFENTRWRRPPFWKTVKSQYLYNY